VKRCRTRRSEAFASRPRAARWLAPGLLALGLLAPVGCRPAPARPALELSDRGLAEAVELLMGDDVRAARELGADEPELALTGTGISGDSLGAFVDIPEGRCGLLLGRGTRGVQDVDVFVFADDGTVLASDEAPSKDATLLVCPAHASRVYASGRLAAGFGLFGLTLQPIPPERAALLGDRFGVSSGKSSEVSELGSNWPGLDERLAEHRRRLGGRWETLRKVALPVDPRAYVDVSASVDAGTCMDLYLTPSDDVAHLELEVIDASGRWIGSGEARGMDRNLMVCSSEPREIAIRSRPHAGRGLAALVVSSSSSAEVGDGTARYDVRPEGDLRSRLVAHDARLARLGYGRSTLLREGALSTERRISVPLSLAPGCSRLDVLTAAPLRSLRAWLWDARGQLMADDVGGVDATLFACGPGTNARLDLDTASRGGAYAIQVRHAAKAPAAAAENALGMGRLLRLLDARRRLASLERLPEVQLARVSDSELARVSLLIPAGRCLELSAALDRGVSGLEVRLLDVTSPSDESEPESAEIGYGSHAATARMCAVKPARDRNLVAELRANVGQGAALWVGQIFDPDPSVRAARAR
jgi:hypothetical protein